MFASDNSSSVVSSTRKSLSKTPSDRPLALLASARRAVPAAGSPLVSAAFAAAVKISDRVASELSASSAEFVPVTFSNSATKSLIGTCEPTRSRRTSSRPRFTPIRLESVSSVNCKPDVTSFNIDELAEIHSSSHPSLPLVWATTGGANSQSPIASVTAAMWIVMWVIFLP